MTEKKDEVAEAYQNIVDFVTVLLPPDEPLTEHEEEGLRKSVMKYTDVVIDVVKRKVFEVYKEDEAH